jgi:hypothetical protein
MPFKVFKTLDLGSISAGAVKEADWTSDDNYTIKRIYFVEKTDASLSNVVGSIFIDSDALTKEDVPVRLFGTNLQNAIDIDRTLSTGKKFKVAVKNNSASSIAIYVVLELHV